MTSPVRRSSWTPRIPGLALAWLLGALAACGDSGTGPGSSGDPAGAQAPSFEDLFGGKLLEADGTQVGLLDVQEKALVGIYFAAGSCPACGAFTPRLVSAYGEMRTAGKSFEIVLVSMGESSDDMFSFMQRYAMPWLTVPYDRAKLEALALRFGIRWIPTLVVLDADRKIVTMNGRTDVEVWGAAAYDHWLQGAP